jgi:hypothetical protein
MNDMKSELFENSTDNPISRNPEKLSPNTTLLDIRKSSIGKNSFGFKKPNQNSGRLSPTKSNNSNTKRARAGAEVSYEFSRENKSFIYNSMNSRYNSS